MDAIEVGRQTAAGLHAQAVAAGCDPWRPYSFAVAEAKRRDLDVEQVSPGAANLKGGRARLIPSDQMILHERTGSDFEKAFLVAHEIGHAHLGDGHDDDEQSTAFNIDPSRAAEPPSIGMERVVDYGRKQRREVQMDLFAREFLLPRPVARALHLNDGMSAQAIADRLGAPLAVVNQQLLDALLLPSVSLQATPHVERALNPLQRRAAEHRGTPYLLEAGPGTGKTQTLVARVKSLLAEGVDPRKILLLTFSNKAAGEMAERIARVDKAAAAAMWIGTFHAFGLDVIRRFHCELDLPADPRLLDRTEAVELLEREFPRLRLVRYRNIYDPTRIIVDILNAISRAKDEVVDPEAYLALAERMRAKAANTEDLAAAEAAIEVGAVYELYEALKQRAKCIDFGDLVLRPVLLLEANEELRQHMQRTYTHVLVDEYQDVNRCSVRLLKAICGEGRNLWAVGDAKQSIYRFRGASSFNMVRFDNADFPGGLREPLKVNYRSVEEITTAFSSFAKDMRVGTGSTLLKSERGKGGHLPVLRKVPDGSLQLPAIAEAIQEMVNDRIPYRDQVVLCTGNEKLSEMGEQLELLNIPVLFLGSLFERPEVKDWLAMLSLLVDRRAMGLVRVACMPEFPMSLSDTGKILGQLRQDDRSDPWWLRIDSSDLSAEGQSSLATLTAMLSRIGEHAEPWGALCDLLLNKTRILARLAASQDVRDAAKCIATWQLLNFTRIQPPGQGLPITRLLERVRRLLLLGDDRDLRQLPLAAQSINAVRLMTIHGAKGLEFPVVHMPGLNEDTLPGAVKSQACPPPEGMVEGERGDRETLRREEHLTERECLFYVALSRARDRLFMYAALATNGNRPRSRSLSSYLERLGNAYVPVSVEPRLRLVEGPEAKSVAVAFAACDQFSNAQISLYASCPRRFFYTHILQVGGRRTPTPFLHMHDAVRKTVQQSVVSPGLSLEAQLDQAFQQTGLHEHGYAPEFRALALSMVTYFLSTRQNHTSEPALALGLQLGSERILVTPDDVLVRSDGRRVFRQIRTGHRRGKEDDDLGAAAFLLAARSSFPDAVVELVHLSDETTLELTITEAKLRNRRDTLSASLADIRQGRYPTNPSSRVCPACPAFFICGPTPPGRLERIAHN
ncbi:MAG: DNA helicase UvrD [Burkholderiales bacterium RIFCSPHIGHO2_01_FULL_64_960]|nr:MAG: DNA helicase UvrD [Burkholderiales bacterium RIFCSPHIGHO2_01_FULL_64_960]